MATKKRTERPERSERTERTEGLPKDVMAGGIFKGLASLVERLGELAEAGEQISKSTEFKTSGAGGKEIKGVYGFSVKMGIGKEGSSFKVEPFGNVGRPEESPAGGSKEAAVHEVREPIVDVFEEDAYTLIVIEMPGVAKDDLSVEVVDDIVTIGAERAGKRYHKEILLSAPVQKKKMTITSNNGVFEIKFKK